MNINPESFVANTVKDLPFSGIRRFFDVAAKMKGAISLGVGEPDFETPWNVREAAIYHLENHRTVYTSNSGTTELRTEISNYLSSRFEMEYNPETEVLVTVGGSEAIDLSLRTIINPGDEIIYVEPCFVPYRPCILLAGGIPVPIYAKAENNFKLTAEELEAAITPKTKALFINYPCNPTGAVMDKTDLEKITAVLRNKNILVISDEIYAELTYSARHVSISTLPGMRERTIVHSGFSKAFAMTGWRLGYVCGPAEIVSQMTKIHQYTIMCVSTNAQYAGVEALRNSLHNVEQMVEAFNMRRRLMLDGFKRIGLPCFEPLGAFYLFPDITQTGLNSEDFCVKLLNQEKLAVVPGTAFGINGEGFIRCSYAYSNDELKAALERLDRHINSDNTTHI